MQKSTRRWATAAAVVLLLGAGLLFLLRSRLPIGEVIDLTTIGGERKLRDPMREARGEIRMLVFALDGVGTDELRAAIRGGGAPSIAGLVGPAAGEADLYAHAYAISGALSILPSITYAAWAAVFTGEPPAINGIPGNEWFVREEMQFYAPAPVSVAGIEHAIEVYTEDLIGDLLRAPTVYEQVQLRSYVSLASVYRGADLLVVPDLSAFGELVAAAAEGLTGEDEVVQEAYENLDRASVESLIGSFREHGIPDLQVVYFPGIDLYTHVADPALREQRAYLRQVTDPAVGAVLEAYRESGVLEETYVLFVSDHGHTPVLADDRHALSTEGADEPPALIERMGFRLRPFVLDPAEDALDYQAVVAYQGAMAYIYLADRSTCSETGDICDWTRPPRFEEDVLPVVRAIDSNNRTGAMIPEIRGALDLILARGPGAAGRNALPFQVWDGARLVPVGEYLARHPRPDLLDFETRLSELSEGPYGHRSGDVLLLAHSSIDRPIEERFYFAKRYRSWHGSASRQDSRISFLVSRAGTSGKALRSRVRALVGDEPSQLDVVALIRGLLAQTPDGRRTTR